MKRLCCALVLLLLAGPAAADSSLPTANGLPIRVQAAMFFAEIEQFSENTATFRATVDVRLRWQDLRLRQPAAEATDPPRLYRGADAQAQLATLWVPDVEIVNQRGSPSYTALGLRIYPDGQVELTRRTTAEFATPYDVERFPFDHQKLQIELAIRSQTADVVALSFDQRDLDASRAATAVHLDGWTVLHVTLRSEPLTGWYGATHARVVATLEIARHPAATATAIAIPLFATLLIPILVIWLNRMRDGQLQLEAHQLINLLIGGLFAVVALNLSINTRYPALSVGDNLVNRLLALSYVTLGICFLINLLLVRFRVVERTLGRHTQEQCYLVLRWAFPALVLTMAVAMTLSAIA
jgi:Neurotransmitter-gated ion-channel ligand binding domain